MQRLMNLQSRSTAASQLKIVAMLILYSILCQDRSTCQSSERTCGYRHLHLEP